MSKEQLETKVDAVRRDLQTDWTLARQEKYDHLRERWWALENHDQRLWAQHFELL